MRAGQLIEFGLENKRQSNIVGVFSYTTDTDSPDCRYSMFRAELGKYINRNRSTLGEDYFVIYGKGQDHNGHFNLTGYDFDNYRHFIKEYHPDSDEKASPVPLIYRYDLTSITQKLFVGKWYWSKEKLLPNINKNSIERDTARYSEQHMVNRYGRLCFTTISNEERNKNVDFEAKINTYINTFNELLQIEHDKESLPFHRITLEKLDF